MMRPLPSPASPPATATADRSSTSSDDINNSWGPYASAGDFKGNALVILSALFCSFLLFLALHSILRFFFCAPCPSPDDSDGPPVRAGPEKKMPPPAKHPVVVFSKDRQIGGMVGATTECAICLCEFAEGDEVRVLPACHHGFHAQCVEAWLSRRLSCPTCRTTPSLPPPPHVSV